jgi:hypothetical protein
MVVLFGSLVTAMVGSMNQPTLLSYLPPAMRVDVLLVLLQAIDVRSDLVEGLFIDHRIDEVAHVAWVAHSEVLEVLKQFLLHGWPDVAGDVGPAGSAALLPLELEGATAQCGGHLYGVGAGVRDHEVLAAGLAHDARVAAVVADVVADLFPQRLEHTGASGEVQARELRMGEDDLARVLAAYMDEVDHTPGRPAETEDCP